MEHDCLWHRNTEKIRSWCLVESAGKLQKTEGTRRRGLRGQLFSNFFFACMSNSKLKFCLVSLLVPGVTVLLSFVVPPNCLRCAFLACILDRTSTVPRRSGCCEVCSRWFLVLNGFPFRSLRQIIRLIMCVEKSSAIIPRRASQGQGTGS